MSRFFDKDLVEQIRQANDIVSVISENVTLKKKGKTYWGCCPFHNEKTPSFSVNADKGLFYCFGCRVGGNVISYVQKYDNLTFPEAVEKLAVRAQIPLPEKISSPESIAREKRNAQIYEVNDLAANFYHNCLTKTAMGKEALAYLHNRGLSDDTIHRFRLGFAPPGWDRLYTAFKDRKFSDAVLIEAGLCRRNKNRVYDYFRERVMFPISDGRGRVLAFGGRVMGKEQPKYLNSSETELFNKSQILFAFDKAYRTIREKKQVILVEGYMDVISAHNKGITNVVASLGTAFTRQQCQLLMRQAEEIILAYDMDGAGRTAVKRAIELTQELEFKVRILSLPSGKDPDEFIRKEGPEIFLQLVDEAESPFEFLLNEALIKFDTTNLQGRISVLNEIFPFIAKVRQSVKREGYLQNLALPLYLDESTIFKYFRSYLKDHKIVIEEQRQERDIVTQKNATWEDKMIAIALTKLEFVKIVLTFIKKNEFETPIYYTILQKAERVYSEYGGYNMVALEEVLTEEERKVVYALMVLDVVNNENAIYAIVHKYRLNALNKKYKEHSILADSLNRAGNSKFIEELKYCQEIQNEIQLWSSVDIEKGERRD